MLCCAVCCGRPTGGQAGKVFKSLFIQLPQSVLSLLKVCGYHCVRFRVRVCVRVFVWGVLKNEIILTAATLLRLLPHAKAENALRALTKFCPRVTMDNATKGKYQQAGSRRVGNSGGGGVGVSCVQTVWADSGLGGGCGILVAIEQ